MNKDFNGRAANHAYLNEIKLLFKSYAFVPKKSAKHFFTLNYYLLLTKNPECADEGREKR